MLHPDAGIRIDRPAVAALLPAALRPRVTIGLGDLAPRAAAIWQALAEPDVALPGGARMTITPTPALTAIDIDAGAATAERRSKKQAQLALNRMLAPAVARQIRLRHLAGAILIDPAGIPQRNRSQLAESFAAALAEDPLRPQFLGFSALGLAEILRPRRHPPLHECLTGAHAEGLAALAALCAAWEAQPASTDSLLAEPAILGAIEADSVARTEFRDRVGRPPLLQTVGPVETAQRWRLVTNLQR